MPEKFYFAISSSSLKVSSVWFKSCGLFFPQKFSSKKKIACLWKSVAFLLKMLKKTLEIFFFFIYMYVYTWLYSHDKSINWDMINSHLSQKHLGVDPRLHQIVSILLIKGTKLCMFSTVIYHPEKRIINRHNCFQKVSV